jgi:hypothetical protein
MTEIRKSHMDGEHIYYQKCIILALRKLVMPNVTNHQDVEGI